MGQIHKHLDQKFSNLEKRIAYLHVKNPKIAWIDLFKIKHANERKL